MCDVDIHGRIDGKGSDGVIFDILARVDYCMNYHTNACAVERGLGETPNLEGGSRAGEFQNHASTYVIGTRTETLVAVTSIACHQCQCQLLVTFNLIRSLSKGLLILSTIY